jgi:uncharacterized protein (DUF924 family)
MKCAQMSEWQQILDFWFGAPDSPTRGRAREEWFKKSADFDAEIRQRFLRIYQRAAAGGYAHWGAEAHSALALLIALDQFPRNMFRNDPRAFATDAQALGIASVAVEQGLDQQLPTLQRQFIYLPFEHAEDLAAQQQSLRLFKSLSHDPQSQTAIDYAQRHYDVIARFGRFPHRNAVLQRVSTPEEIDFLKQPGSSF